MGDTPEGEELEKLFGLTERIHRLATEDMTERLARHLALGASMGATTCIGARVSSPEKFDGVVFMLVGPKITSADAEAFMDYAKRMLQDIDPAAAKQFSPDEPS